MALTGVCMGGGQCGASIEGRRCQRSQSCSHGSQGAALRAALRDLLALVRHHEQAARAALPELVPAARLALMPLALVAPLVGRLESALTTAGPAEDPAAALAVDLSPLGRLWALWRFARRLQTGPAPSASTASVDR